jgi:hypothetical protein
MTTPPPTPAGWYPDPQAPGYQRYWDGSQWTEHVAPLVGAPPGPPPVQTGTSSSTVVMIVVGVIVGFLVLMVLLIAAVTLLGGNASSKFSTIGSSIN